MGIFRSPDLHRTVSERRNKGRTGKFLQLYVEQPVYKNNLLSPSTTEAKKVWSFTSIPQYIFTLCCSRIESAEMFSASSIKIYNFKEQSLICCTSSVWYGCSEWYSATADPSFVHCYHVAPLLNHITP